MPNSKNNEEWVEPSNIPKPLREFFLDDDSLGALLGQIANASTLDQMTSAVEIAYEGTLFLEEL